MIEKAKKVYEAPSMKVYEIGRTQILAVSTAVDTEGYGDDTDSPLWN